jgi:hypothetical protein
MRPPIGSVLLCILPFVAACGSAGATAGVVTRDSAGIAIVENAALTSAGLAEWTVDSTPVIDIGALEGGEGETLFRVAGALKLSDGRLVVANGGTSQLFYYRPDGTLERTVGRKGGGPGEFQMMAGLVRLAGDSVLVMDLQARRADVIDPSGAFVRDFTPGGVNTFASVMGRLSDGRWVGTGGFVLGADEIKDGLQRNDMVFVIFAPDGAPDDTIAVVPGSERYLKIQRSGNRVMAMLRPRPFGRSTQSAVSGEALWVGTQDEPEVRQYTADGRLTRIVRTGTELKPVTDEQVDAFVDEQVASLTPDQQRSAREDYADMPMAKTMPPYASMMVDADGNLWLEDTDDYMTPAGGWTVYDPDGRAIARIRLPEHLRVYDIGQDYVLGRESDDLDVEHVRMYRLRRLSG